LSIIYKALNNLQSEDVQSQGQPQNRLNLVPEHNLTGVLAVAGVSTLVIAVLLGRWLPVDSGSAETRSETARQISQDVSGGRQEREGIVGRESTARDLVARSQSVYVQQPVVVATAQGEPVAVVSQSSHTIGTAPFKRPVAADVRLPAALTQVEEGSLTQVMKHQRVDNHDARKVPLESLPRLSAIANEAAKAKAPSKRRVSNSTTQLTSAEIQQYRSAILYFVRSGKISEAQKKLEELRRVMPSGGFIEKLSAYVEGQAGNVQTAYDNYQTLLVGSQADPVSQFNAALLAIKLKKYSAARQHLQMSAIDNRYMARSNALLASLPLAVEP